MLVDSHAHLAHEGYLESLDVLLARAQTAGVSRIINISTSLEELEQALSKFKACSWIDHACAITPQDVAQLGELQFEAIAAYARKGALIAIGETGLDYYYTQETKFLQKDFLKRYLALARQCHLPVIIHCRDAFKDFFSVLDEVEPVRGVLHCFTGTLEDAQELINRDWMLSVSGIVTFKKSEVLQQVAKWVPLDHLLIETDAPYLAPQPFRGKPNEPSYLVHTAKFIAQLRGITFEELAASTTANATKLFGPSKAC
ncbi:MAG: TatD family hydrolase [Verrucomicrobia bacterium]|nr:TatD family hydrolase [Verrucomicrobiota bacterium]MBS0645398.1 TatD family hydrolase [Verrucomicrobiota bacterium]